MSDRAEITGLIKDAFSNKFGWAFKIQVNQDLEEVCYLNKNKDFDPLKFDYKFLIGKAVWLSYWITNSGYKVINTLKEIEGKETKVIHDNGLSKIEDKETVKQEEPKLTEYDKLHSLELTIDELKEAIIELTNELKKKG